MLSITVYNSLDDEALLWLLDAHLEAGLLGLLGGHGLLVVLILHYSGGNIALDLLEILAHSG